MELEHFESLYPENTRFEEIKKILSIVKEGNSCQVVSAAGVGRSNLLGLLSYNRNIRIKHLGIEQKNFHFVLLNFSEIRKRPINDANKFIFLGILDSLRERGLKNEYEEVNKIFKESIEFNDELVIFSRLKKIIDFLTIEKNLTLVLLFDRFEEYVPMLTSEFFANLRVLRNRAKYHFSVLFSLNRPLEDLIEPSLFADFFEYVAGRIIYLKIMDKTGLDFRISYLEKVSGKKADKKILDKILSLTKGHGRLTILCLETILSLEKIPNDNSQFINFLFSKRPIRSSLFAIWNSLNPSEQKYFVDKKLEPVFLENIFLADNGNVTIPLFEDFVKKEIIPSEKFKKEQSEQILLDKETNEIKKGEIVISDQLTSFEFKLLKYFILNTGKILEKEDIINNVWGEQKTTLGVTDQALDQLIFRLRKKIEENPNEPKYLFTIKGRGFKFS
ncbi:MAG TPA: helix-turn-helix domain-containing protein [Candidatus Sulfotelmatobacter sp.]|nr:helix-turn-helix domain-containing protein [Candidatus Sulfotelmatobacter sp.]